MSRLLCDAVIRALREAHGAYLRQNAEEYRECLKVAQCGIEGIRMLGVEDDFGREMELMGLEAELTLLYGLAGIHVPSEMIMRYEAAVLKMLMPPSKVVPKDAPLIAHCENTLDFFGGVCDQTAKDLELAVNLYGRLTDGGGGGVAEIYRAQMAEQRGNCDEARRWAALALERMCGDKWIEPIAEKLIKSSDGGMRLKSPPARE